VFVSVFFLGSRSHRLAAGGLGIASLSFYAVWDVRFLLLLLGSIAFNYGSGYWISIFLNNKNSDGAKKILIFSIVANLILLGYFKYTNFFIKSVNSILTTHLSILDIALPLGISFFTFTQIAFLVDAARGKAREFSIVNYILFVTYFPHLVAGPVLHHKQMMPQFAAEKTYRLNPEHIAIGLNIFVFGLAKKVLVADSLAQYSTPIFDAVRDGNTLMFFEAWIGALAYTLQLYFDFSGYSDMAIGLSLIFNIKLPLNFDSPYKAKNVIDFWRRWHMTLSAFLRDYLYISLGGNRHGSFRRYLNLMLTMLLGGLWHGAGWTFIVWGALHGAYLMINHGWRGLKKRWRWTEGGRWAGLSSAAITFLAVVFAWVFFRADTVSGAISIIQSMAGLNGVALPTEWASKLLPLSQQLPFLSFEFSSLTPISGVFGKSALFTIAVGLLIVWTLPNVCQSLRQYRPSWEDAAGIQTPSGNEMPILLRWKMTPVYSAFIGILFFVCLLELSRKSSEFLYFQF